MKYKKREGWNIRKERDEIWEKRVIKYKKKDGWNIREERDEI